MAAKCTCWSVPHAVGCVPLSRVVSARDMSWPDSDNFHDLGLLSSRGPGDTHSGVVSSHGAAGEERKRETVLHRTHKGVEAGKFCLWEAAGGAVLDLSFLPHPDFQAMSSHFTLQRFSTLENRQLPGLCFSHVACPEGGTRSSCRVSS